jgi:hypothetical protein
MFLTTEVENRAIDFERAPANDELVRARAQAKVDRWLSAQG